MRSIDFYFGIENSEKDLISKIFLILDRIYLNKYFLTIS